MSWLHRVLGRDGATQLAVDPTHFAARIAGRPMEVGARGSYALGITSNIMAAGLAANGEIFCMRWSDATRVCLMRSIVFNAWRDTTVFTAGSASFVGIIRRAWTVDPTGGTNVTFSTGTNKKRTDFPNSLFGDNSVRCATTAILTPSTGTYDSFNFCGAGAFISSAATTAADTWIIPPGYYLWQRNTHDEYPLLFEQNEGFCIRATVPATGTWHFVVQVEWAELDPALVNGW